MYAVEILEIKEKLQNLFFKRNRVSFHCFQKYINEFYLNISGFSTKDVTYMYIQFKFIRRKFIIIPHEIPSNHREAFNFIPRGVRHVWRFL